MKKIIYALFLVSSSLAFGQITLKGSIEQRLYIYNNNDFYYVAVQNRGTDGAIKIYNSNLSTYKTISFSLPEGYNSIASDNSDYLATKGIFTLDNKFDFIVVFYSEDNKVNPPLMRIYHEDGTLVKEFNPNEIIVNIYYDPIAKTNILLTGIFEGSTRTYTTRIYNLPSSGNLGTNDNKIVSKTLKVYPNPVSTTLTINNIDSEGTQAQIFDMSGRMVKTVSFGKGDKNINLDVSALGKGNYLVKVGSSVSKFIKN